MRISPPGWRSGLACGCGTRQFGVGNVISVEPLDDDTKLVVRFAAVGVKTLRAKLHARSTRLISVPSRSAP